MNTRLRIVDWQRLGIGKTQVALVLSYLDRAILIFSRPAVNWGEVGPVFNEYLSLTSQIVMTSLIASLLCCLFVSGLDKLDLVDLSLLADVTPGGGEVGQV